jgi:hypothetical protein
VQLKDTYVEIGRLRADIDNLRAMMTNGNQTRVQVVQVPVPQQPASGEAFTKAVAAQPQQPARANKWSKFVGDSQNAVVSGKGDAAGSMISVDKKTRAQQATKVETFEVAAEEQAVAKPVKPVRMQQPLVVEKAAVMVNRQQQPQNVVDGLVRVRFPHAHNADLYNWFLDADKDSFDWPITPTTDKSSSSSKSSKSRSTPAQVLLHDDCVDVWVSVESSLDDLIFNIRRLVAERVSYVFICIVNIKLIVLICTGKDPSSSRGTQTAGQTSSSCPRYRRRMDPKAESSVDQHVHRAGRPAHDHSHGRTDPHRLADRCLGVSVGANAAADVGLGQPSHVWLAVGEVATRLQS